MSAMEKKEGKKKGGFFAPIVKYFREVKSELKKVVFPTARQTRINTTVVIVAVIIVGIVIGVLDFLFNTGRNYIINYESTPTEQTDNTTNEITDENGEVDPVEAAQLVLDELDSYTYDEEGNAVDENGDIIVTESAEGSVELTADRVAELRENAQSIIDEANAENNADDSAEAGENASEGSND